MLLGGRWLAVQDVAAIRIVGRAGRNREGADLGAKDRLGGVVDLRRGINTGDNEGENECADEILHFGWPLYGSKVVAYPIALDRTYGVNIVLEST